MSNFTVKRETTQYLRNGNINDGHGWRCIVVNYDLKKGILNVRPMISQVTRAPHYFWCGSVQSLYRGDHVIISSWGLDWYDIKAYQYQNGKRMVELKNPLFINKLMEALPECIRHFLQKIESGPSYLPSGYWRKKYDMCETRPITLVERFLSGMFNKSDKKWLDFICQEASISPSAHLIMDWNDNRVKPLPDSITNHKEYWYNEDQSPEDYLVLNSMVWVLQHEDLGVEVIEPEPTSGHECIGPSRRIGHTYKGLSRGMPSTVIRAIKFNLGAYEKDGRSYGCRWYLYKR